VEPPPTTVEPPPTTVEPPPTTVEPPPTTDEPPPTTGEPPPTTEEPPPTGSIPICHWTGDRYQRLLVDEAGAVTHLVQHRPFDFIPIGSGQCPAPE
jgi:hypothetical protein